MVLSREGQENEQSGCCRIISVVPSRTETNGLSFDGCCSGSKLILMVMIATGMNVGCGHHKILANDRIKRRVKKESLEDNHVA